MPSHPQSRWGDLCSVQYRYVFKARKVHTHLSRAAASSGSGPLYRRAAAARGLLVALGAPSRRSSSVTLARAGGLSLGQRQESTLGPTALVPEDGLLAALPVCMIHAILDSR